MAASTSSSFSLRGGAGLPTDLGQALTEQLARLFRRGAAVPAADRLAGPSFTELEPGLRDEAARR